MAGRGANGSDRRDTPAPPAVVPGKSTTVAPRPPAFNIVSAGRTERWFKGMIYGDYGVGKTTVAASADDIQDMKDVLFIDAEAGDMSLSDRPGIDVIRITSFRQMARVQEFLRLHCQWRDSDQPSAVDELIKLEERFRGEVVKGSEVKKYRTVIIDSLSEVQKFCMYQLLGVRVGEQRLDTETPDTSYGEWGKQLEMIRLLVRTFRDLPMHVIFVCSEQVGEDDKKRRIRRPNLSGKLASEVQGFLDTVGYMVLFKGDNGENKRRLYITPGQTFQAKHRLPGNTTSYIEDPTMASLLALGRTARSR